jgi:hypothetical protein
MHTLIRALSVSILMLALPAQAERSIEIGDVVVHYSAVPSLSLTPQIARQYAITRSAGRALLNISVLRRAEDGSHSAITAAVSAAATNLNGQRQSIAVREVREGDAIYYLGEPRIGEGETLDFEFTVDPEGEPGPIDGRFRQQFFSPR